MNIKLPFSNTTREYINERGIRFTDTELANIFLRHISGYEDCLDALRALADGTADEALKAQLLDRLDYEETQKRAFFDNSGGGYIYVSAKYDDGSGAEYFRSAESAFAYMKKHGETDTVLIEKKEINSDKPDAGYCRYDRSGRILSLQMYGCGDEPADAHGANDRFENIIVSFEYPFERGDIVRCGFLDALIVLESSNEEVTRQRERVLTNPDDLIYEETDYTTVWASFISENGEISTAECDFLELEKVTEKPDDISAEEWELAVYISKLIRGRERLYNLDYFRKRYIDSLRK